MFENETETVFQTRECMIELEYSNQCNKNIDQLCMPIQDNMSSILYCSTIAH